MANAKAANRAASRRLKATVTTALMVDAGAALPKGATRFSFTTSDDALKLFKGRPGKIKPLLQGYGKAVAESHRAGRSVSFRVDVDPEGDATVTSVDAGVSSGDNLPLEQITERDPELERALEAARERGRLRAGEVLAGEDMLSADAFAELLGTTRVTVNAKRQSGQVLGLEGAKRGFRFPSWQVDGDGKPYRELPELLQRLRAPWAVYRFLIQPQGALEGMTGRQALERGRGRDVLVAAEGIAQGDFT
jgi:hypothetical protein